MAVRGRERVLLDVDGKTCWISSRRAFKVKFFIKIFILELALISWKSISRNKVPLRVAFYTWMTALGKNLMLDTFRKKSVVVSEWCWVCKKSGKNIDHLLLYCEVTTDLWASPLSTFGTVWCMGGGVVS